MLREIKTFLAIHRYGTFAAAAEQLGCTQSAVSAQIKALEQNIGVALFDRSKRGGVLSEAGLRAVPLCEQIIHLFEKIMNQGQGILFSECLKIATPSYLSSQMILPVCTQLPHHFPNTRLEWLMQDNLCHALNDLSEHRVHLAITENFPMHLPDDYVSEMMAADEWVLVFPKTWSYLDNQNLLSKKPFLEYKTSIFYQNHVNAFLKNQQIHNNPILVSADVESIVACVRQNQGVAIVPYAGTWTQNAHTLGVRRIAELTDSPRTLTAIVKKENAHLLQLLRLIWQPTQWFMQTPMSYVHSSFYVDFNVYCLDWRGFARLKRA